MVFQTSLDIIKKNCLLFTGDNESGAVCNGWVTSASIKLIGGTRLFINGQDLIAQMLLQLVQKKPSHKLMSIQDEADSEDDDNWVSSFLSSLNGREKYVKLKNTSRIFCKSQADSKKGTKGVINIPK